VTGDGFQHLNWHSVPTDIRAQFVDFLSLLAINHVHHVETVLQAACNHFQPFLTPSQATAAEDSESKAVVERRIAQKEVYSLAHKCIRLLIQCHPL
jgi:RNA polymerase I specific transcription initiation factor RRN3